MSGGRNTQQGFGEQNGWFAIHQAGIEIGQIFGLWNKGCGSFAFFHGGFHSQFSPTKPEGTVQGLHMQQDLSSFGPVPDKVGSDILYGMPEEILEHFFDARGNHFSMGHGTHQQPPES